MDLFGKMRNLAEIAKDKIMSVVSEEEICSEEHPLADETVRRYYEIVYGLLASVQDIRDEAGHVTHKGKRIPYSGVKKYVEHFEGGKANEEILQKVLMYFCESADDCRDEKAYLLYYREGFLITSLTETKKFSKWTANQIIEINNELANDTKYRHTREDAIEICFPKQDAIRGIRSRYKAALAEAAVKGIGTLSDNVYKIVEKYKERLDPKEIKELICNITRERVLAGETTTQSLVLRYVNHAFQKAKGQYVSATVTLRALHFEQYGHNEEGYTTFTKEECRTLIQEEKSLQGDIDVNAENAGSLIGQIVSKIKSEIVLFDDWHWWNFYCWMPKQNDTYYMDMLCNLYWKTYAPTDSMEITTVYRALSDSIQNA